MDVDELVESATTDFFWVPDDVEVVDREAITYTYSDRPSGKYNHVTRTRPERADPAALVEEVRERHEGSESAWSVTPLSDSPDLRGALEERGWQEGERHHAYAIRSDEYERDVPDDVEVREVETVDDLWRLYELWSEIFGGVLNHDREDLEYERDDCTGPDRRVARFVAYRSGEAAGIAAMTFFDDLSFSFIWGGGVREEHRGHGVYTKLLQRRADVAARRGIEWLGLYARDETSGPIVDAHGFEQYGYMINFHADFRE